MQVLRVIRKFTFQTYELRFKIIYVRVRLYRIVQLSYCGIFTRQELVNNDNRTSCNKFEISGSFLGSLYAYFCLKIFRTGLNCLI